MCSKLKKYRGSLTSVLIVALSLCWFSPTHAKGRSPLWYVAAAGCGGLSYGSFYYAQRWNRYALRYGELAEIGMRLDQAYTYTQAKNFRDDAITERNKHYAYAGFWALSGVYCLYKASSKKQDNADAAFCKVDVAHSKVSLAVPSLVFSNEHFQRSYGLSLKLAQVKF